MVRRWFRAIVAVILLWSVQNFRRIHQLRGKLWANKVLRDCSSSKTSVLLRDPVLDTALDEHVLVVLFKYLTQYYLFIVSDVQWILSLPYRSMVLVSTWLIFGSSHRCTKLPPRGSSRSANCWSRSVHGHQGIGGCFTTLGRLPEWTCEDVTVNKVHHRLLWFHVRLVWN